MQLKIFLPKNIQGSCYLSLSLSNQKLKLLNSNIISQKYNPNIEIEEIYEKKKNTYHRGIYILNFQMEILRNQFESKTNKNLDTFIY